MFRSYDHLQGATLFLAKVTYLKSRLINFLNFLNSVLWQHAATAPS